jgi:hypothetical protein
MTSQRINRLRHQNLGRLHEVQVNALIILAWNCYRSGKPVSLSDLSWTETRDYPGVR